MSENSVIERVLPANLVRTQLELPRRYKVIMLNDDYTPMEFVIEILMALFRMDAETATRVMLEVHLQGQAICGCYSREIAETKVMQVIRHARQHEHPLLCRMEPE